MTLYKKKVLSNDRLKIAKPFPLQLKQQTTLHLVSSNRFRTTDVFCIVQFTENKICWGRKDKMLM